MAGFVVGNRDFPPFFVGLSLAAQLTSVATFVVNPGLIYAYGLPALLGLGVAACLGITIGITVLSKGFRRVGEQLHALTLPGWLGSRYKSPAMQIGFALLSLALVSFMVLIVVAMAYVLMKMLGVPAWAAMLGVILLVFSYVLLGGANTSVYTNSVQALIMVGVALVLIGSGLSHFAGGLEPFLAKLKAIDAHLVGLVNVKSLYFRNLFEVFVCNFLVGLAIVCQPHVMAKALSLKNNRDLNRYLITAIVVGTVFMMVMLTGLYARLVLPPMSTMDLVIPTYIDTQFSPIMGVVISIGVLCAGVSTLEGLLLALSGILASDLFMPVLKNRLKDQSPERQMKLTLSLARISLLVIGVVTFGLGLYQIKHPTGGSVAIFAQYGIYCLFSAAFAPMLFGMFFKVVPQVTALLAAATAVIVYVGMSLFQITSLHNNPAVLSACAITSSTLVMGLGVLYKKLLISAAKRRVASWGKREPRHVTSGMYK
jgi:SSS family solute:Na+ symporter/sodium/pantothenate symporter